MTSVAWRRTRWAEAERLRRPEVDHEIELARLLHQEVRGLGAFEDTADTQPLPATGGEALPGPGVAPPETHAAVTVRRVIDGDTIEVEFEDGAVARVRLIGVDTPETVDPRRPVQCFGAEASARTRELLDGQRVWLERDVSQTDRFGRLLRYV